MSYNIRELEKQLKVRLFNTNSRGVEPTKYAEELYPLVRKAFTHLLTAEDTILDFNEKSQGVVHLSISLYYMPQIVGQMVSNFNQAYKNVKFEIAMTNTAAGNEALERHESDIFMYAYTKEEAYNKHEYTVINIMELENRFFASADFLKANNLGTTITKEQLLSSPVMTVTSIYPMHGELEKLGIKNPLVETNSTQMLINLASNNMGIIFGPDKYVATGLVKLDVKDIQTPKCRIAVKYNNSIANKAGIAFIEHIVNLFCRRQDNA
jgi:DNA-binding transcriptional LysR family regulator